MLKDPLSIVIPCFNEESSIQEVLAELAEKRKGFPMPCEVIVVDDGSTDRTFELVQQSPAPDRVLRHRGNRGYGASIKTGIKAAAHEYVLIMDGDGQHPPDNILALWEEAETCDMVIGARQGLSSPGWRMPGKMALKTICEILVRRRIPDINSGFRLLRKSEALKYLHLCSDQFSFSTTSTLAFISDRLSVRFVPIGIRRRKSGKSQVNVATGFSTLMLILRTVGTFSPLRIFMPPALLSFLIGFGLLIQGLVQSNVGDVAILGLIMGLILFCFGLLADQMALLRREINKS